jgi:hypothetical protein
VSTAGHVVFAVPTPDGGSRASGRATNARSDTNAGRDHRTVLGLANPLSGRAAALAARTSGPVARSPAMAARGGRGLSGFRLMRLSARGKELGRCEPSTPAWNVPDAELPAIAVKYVLVVELAHISGIAADRKSRIQQAPMQWRPESPRTEQVRRGTSPTAWLPPDRGGHEAGRNPYPREHDCRSATRVCGAPRISPAARRAQSSAAATPQRSTRSSALSRNQGARCRPLSGNARDPHKPIARQTHHFPPLRGLRGRHPRRGKNPHSSRCKAGLGFEYALHRVVLEAATGRAGPTTRS